MAITRDWLPKLVEVEPGRDIEGAQLTSLGERVLEVVRRG